MCNVVMSKSQAAHNICLVLLVGLPGSGKTTLAHFIKQVFGKEEEASNSTLSLNVIHICYDQIITIDVGRCCSSDSDSLWSEARQEVITMVEKVVNVLKCSPNAQETYQVIFKECGDFKLIHSDFEWDICMNRRTVIVLDDNMYYRSMRYSYYQLARRLKLGFCQLFIDCPVDSALEFNERRISEERVPEAVIKKMANRLEPPTGQAWEQYSVTLQAHKPYSNDKVVDEIQSTLLKALQNPVQEVDKNSDHGEICQQNSIASVLYQCDLGLRHLVNERMKVLQESGLGIQNLRAQSKILVTTRADLLSAIKSNAVVIPEDLCTALSLNHPLAVTQLRAFLSALFDKYL